MPREFRSEGSYYNKLRYDLVRNGEGAPLPERAPILHPTQILDKQRACPTAQLALSSFFTSAATKLPSA
jgi:hypothetical protein